MYSDSYMNHVTRTYKYSSLPSPLLSSFYHSHACVGVHTHLLQRLLEEISSKCPGAHSGSQLVHEGEKLSTLQLRCTLLCESSKFKVKIHNLK